VHFPVLHFTLCHQFPVDDYKFVRWQQSLSVSSGKAMILWCSYRGELLALTTWEAEDVHPVLLTALSGQVSFNNRNASHY
jgi:hypothetical protein